MTIDIEALKASCDLAAIVGHYTPLTKKGAEFVGRCIAHSPDNNPSMYVNPAKGIIKCFACGWPGNGKGGDVIDFIMEAEGCDFKAACEKLGASPDWKPAINGHDLKPKPPRALLVPTANDMPDFKHPKLGEPSAVWTFRTLTGEPWFYEARYDTPEGKETRLWTYGRYSDADTPRWECKHPAKPKPLYGLEQLTQHPGKQVMIHEAAKKAEAGKRLFPSMLHLGLLGGAGGVGLLDLSPLAGRKCVLVPDNDEAGRQCMSRLAVLLHAAGAAEVKGINTETLPSGESPTGWDLADATDWTPEIALRWAKERIEVYPIEQPIETQPEPEREPAQPEPPTIAQEPQPAPSDAQPAVQPAESQAQPHSRKPDLEIIEGNTRRKPKQEIEPEVELLPAFSEFALAGAFADTVGENWRYTAAWGAWAKWDGIRWIQDEKKVITWDVKAVCTKAVHSHRGEATPSQRMKITTLKTVNAVMGLAASDPRIATGADAWDGNPMLLGTPDGIIDLRDGASIAADKALLISKSTCCAPCDGPHPWWDMVLERATHNDAAMLRFIQRWCGYLLTGDTREERFLFIHGPGGGGKSKFLAPIAEIMGDYRRTAKMESFTAKDRTEHSEEIARLAGARMVTATETEEGSRWNESRITALTGRDTIAARHMHRSTFQFQPQFKLIFVGNHKPALRSVGEEMRRRIDLIEWGGTIPESERILDLPEKLRAEYPAILAWMIEGCLQWQEHGLGKPEQVTTAIKDYLQGEDTMGAWLDECCVMEDGKRTAVSDAYRNFKRWADAAGEYTPSQKRFSQKLKDRGILSGKSGYRYFIGFTLRESGQHETPAYYNN